MHFRVIVEGMLLWNQYLSNYQSLNLENPCLPISALTNALELDFLLVGEFGMLNNVWNSIPDETVSVFVIELILLEMEIA